MLFLKKWAKAFFKLKILSTQLFRNFNRVKHGVKNYMKH